ncbi:MAG: alpha/beta hydrolase family protein [Terriglobales bacterium]
MKRFLSWQLPAVLIVSVASVVGQTRVAAPAPLAGFWIGQLQGTPLHLELHLTRQGTTWHGVFTSVDQGGARFPATAISVKGTQVVIQAAEAGATFTATLAEGRLSGTWKQGGNSLALVLRRAHAAAAPAAPPRPQRPKPPFPYRSTGVTVSSMGGIKLAGTLTVPDGKGPFPAAILIGGSGPSNRNETVFGHNIFWVLADALSRHGLAVLRMDKRGIGQSGGDARTATLNDYAEDVDADLAFLRLQPKIDAQRIGLIGHSEGGAIAPMVASRHAGEVAFVILLAGPAMPGTQMIVDQVEALDAAHGLAVAEVAKAGAMEGVWARTIAAAPDAAAVPAALHEAVAQGKLPKGILREAGMAATPEYYGLMRLNPGRYLRQLRCPVLALDGSKDVQVPAAANIAALRAALAHDPHATIVELPGLNHLFQPAQTGLPNEYASIPITFAPSALHRIERWLAGVVGSKP